MPTVKLIINGANKFFNLNPDIISMVVIINVVANVVLKSGWKNINSRVMTKKGKYFFDTVELTVSLANEIISTAVIKSELRSKWEIVNENVVFGEPTLLVDDQVFWGNDSKDICLNYLENPDIFDNFAMKKLTSLQIWCK